MKFSISQLFSNFFPPEKTDRTWDFEGRCVECHKPLDLFVKPLGKHIILTVQDCKDHPDGAHILWPQRDDIKVIY